MANYDIKGSKTEANLLAAFSGESQARNKYTYYASKARKDGYVQIANIFEAVSYTHLDVYKRQPYFSIFTPFSPVKNNVLPPHGSLAPRGLFL